MKKQIRRTNLKQACVCISIDDAAGALSLKPEGPKGWCPGHLAFAILPGVYGSGRGMGLVYLVGGHPLRDGYGGPA